MALFFPSDSASKSLTFKSDKFSTYALAYDEPIPKEDTTTDKGLSNDKISNETIANTLDEINIAAYVIMFAASSVGLCAVNKRKKED